jgi:hypothetical protein
VTASPGPKARVVTARPGHGPGFGASKTTRHDPMQDTQPMLRPSGRPSSRRRFSSHREDRPRPELPRETAAAGYIERHGAKLPWETGVSPGADQRTAEPPPVAHSPARPVTTIRSGRARPAAMNGGNRESGQD